jgi:hypothetical protein
MPRYLIFARTRYEEPLELQGEFEVADDEAAARSAVDELGGEGWIEIQLVPESTIRRIVRPAEEEAVNV